VKRARDALPCAFGRRFCISHGKKDWGLDARARGEIVKMPGLIGICGAPVPN
jgi:hypothetical protein